MECLEKVDPALRCALCKAIAVGAQLSRRCGHSFCKRCVAKLRIHDAMTEQRVNQGFVCPIDQQPITQGLLIQNKSVQDQVGALRVRCKYCGCGEPSVAPDQGESGSSCSPKACHSPRTRARTHPSSPSQSLTVRLYEIHADVCTHRPVQCPNSSDCLTLPYNQLKEHLTHCKRARCRFSVLGCPEEGLLEPILKHQEECMYQKGLDSSFTQGVVHSFQPRLDQLMQQMELLTQRATQLDQKVSHTLESGHAFEKIMDQIKVSEQEPPELEDSTEAELSDRDDILDFQMPFTFKSKGLFRGHQGPIWALAVSPDERVFTGSSDETIKCWDVSSFACLSTIECKQGVVHCLCISVDGSLLFVGTSSGKILCYNTSTFQQTAVVNVGESIISCLAVDENHLYFGSFGIIKALDLAQELKQAATTPELNHWVRDLKLQIKQQLLYSASGVNVNVWRAGSLQPLKEFKTEFGSVRSLCTTFNLLITGTHNQNIHIYDMESAEHQGKLVGHLSAVLAMTHSPGGQFLFCGGGDGSITIWDLQCGLQVQIISRHEADVNALAWCGDKLLSVGSDATLRVYKFMDMRPRVDDDLQLSGN
eukprot:m.251946 g.251946  ORF g.251946 m.251946 type:complete len:592 (+) comp15464_c0_seq2:277-2052(+)